MNTTSLIKAIENNLPKIDGVDWMVGMYREPAELKLCVRIIAKFHVDEELPTQDLLYEIGQKAHQITCGGQIKLELEK